MVAGAEVIAVVGDGSKLGQAVVAELQQRGYEVRRSVSPDVVAVIALSGVDHHSPSNSFEEFEATLSENVQSTTKLLSELQATAKAHLKSLVHVSSKEAAEAATYYGASKLAAEKYVALFANTAEIPCASVRVASSDSDAARAIIDAMEKRASGVIDA